MTHINRIAISNFKQYKNVELVFNDRDGLYLFIGKNGMGKSNFLNAIYWCLYEKIPFRFHEQHGERPELLNEEVSDKSPDEQVKVEIEIEMDDSIYLFKRTWVETWGKSQFFVMKKENQDWIRVIDPIIIRNKFLPESISKYFIFDGEAVVKLYKGDYSNNLKDGIRLVSGISLVDSAIEHLSKTFEDMRKRLSKDSPATNDLEDELRVKKDEKKSLESQNSIDKNLIAKLKEDVKRLNEDLGKYSKYRQIIETKKLLEQEAGEKEKQINELRIKENKILVEFAPFGYTKDVLSETARQISQAGTRGELPPKIKSAFIDELLENSECICGTHIAEGDKTYYKLILLKERVSPLGDREYLIEDKINISAIIKKVDQEIPTELKEISKNISKYRQRLLELTKMLKDYNEQLKNAPEPVVGDIQSTIDTYSAEIETKIRDTTIQEEIIKDLSKKISEIEERIERLNRYKVKFERENDKVEFVKEANDKINQIREKVISQVQKSVSLSTGKFFKDLIWKKDDFDKVSFTDDYEVEIIKRGGKLNSLKDLSNGEMKVLSLATIKALDEISGFSGVPLFIDGPLEYLDEEVQDSILELLPKYFERKQVFIFSLDKPKMIDFGRKHIDKHNFYHLTRLEGLSTNIIEYVEH